MSRERDISLSASAAEFEALLQRCEISGKNGAALGLEPGISAAMEILAGARERGASIYIVGNGGSASVASHAVVDMVNVAKLRAFTLHDASLLTCMTNDYGYENAFARVLGHVIKPGDTLVAISSSGRSQNIRNAAQVAAENGGAVITLSGFTHDNPLRVMGDVNIWLNSGDYGLVEIGHQFILHNLSDRFGVGHMAGETL